MSPLRRRMIEDITVRNLSRSTQQSYVYAVTKFSRHFNRAPDQLGMEEVRAYQLHLVALEGGTYIRIIQVMLGHSHLETTARYAQVATSLIAGTPSPFDRLSLEVIPPE